MINSTYGSKLHNEYLRSVKDNFDIICDTILGKDYYIVDPVNGITANDIIREDIIKKWNYNVLRISLLKKHLIVLFGISVALYIALVITLLI